MTEPRITTHELDVTTAGEWSFRDGSLSWTHRTIGISGVFDPFPAYAHDADVAARTARLVEAACPPLWPIEIHLANREERGRTNGFSSVSQKAGDNPERPHMLGLVVMSAKRIPIHPAMTRYLVAHECGHNCAWMISRLYGEQYARNTSWLADYAQMRGLPPESVHFGSGGTWHDSVEEVFACDFRILVCGVEAEYWPHPGIAHCDELPAVASWWRGVAAELRSAQ